MRCGLYIRVSTEMQKERGESLDVQLRRLKAAVESKNWGVAEIYKDAGISAKNINRPEFARMMSDIEGGKIDVILCTKLDRLFRNTKDFIDTTEYFDKKNIKFVCLEADIDTTTASGRAFSAIRAVFGQLERETTGERVRDVMRSRAEQGKWNGGITPYGYFSKDKQLIINDKEARVVRDIYNTYMQNRSIRNTVHRLNDDDKKTRDNKLWTLTSVRRILTNPFYYGFLTYSKRSHNFNGQLRRNKTYILNPGKHSQIISKELFDKVQAIIQQQTKAAPRTNAKYMLTGIVYCGVCGSRMHGMKTGRPNMKHEYYRCSGHIQKGNCQCKGNGIRVDEAEKSIIGSLKGLSINKNRLKELLTETMGSQGKRSDEQRGRLRPLENRLTRIEDKRRKIFELYEEGSISKNEFMGRKTSFDEEESFARAQIEQLESQPGSTDISSYDLDYTLGLCKDMKDVFDELGLEDRKETLRKLMPQVTVNSHDIDYDIQVPLKLISSSQDAGSCVVSGDTGKRDQRKHKQALRLSFKISRYPDKTLGQRIRKARLEKGLLQVDLAKKLKVDEMSIVNWELDKTIPRKESRKKLKKLLSILI
jgi:site-specific DNA recombinase